MVVDGSNEWKNIVRIKFPAPFFLNHSHLLSISPLFENQWNRWVTYVKRNIEEFIIITLFSNFRIIRILVLVLCFLDIVIICFEFNKLYNILQRSRTCNKLKYSVVAQKHCWIYTAGILSHHFFLWLQKAVSFLNGNSLSNCTDNWTYRSIHQFHATGLSTPPENIRKPEVFWWFQVVKKEISGMKRVNEVALRYRKYSYLD